MKTPKVLTITASLCFSTLVILAGCMKDRAVDQTASTATTVGTPKHLFGIMVRLKWDGGGGAFGPQWEEACAGSDCGNCPGFCVRFTRKAKVSNPGPLLPDENWVDMIVDEPNEEVMVVPYGDADNGDAYTRVTEDWVLPADVAEHLGYRSITIPSGTYAVDYSNQQEPYGHILFTGCEIEPL